MSLEGEPIHAVPTNVITGFLGVGKTTAILDLLRQKPLGERWAVLVNEFGEIGVDGSLVQGQMTDDDIHVREVPGGCMCCTAGLPMQIALNQLLRRARPQRLLIEPTGLGHPIEVLQTLGADYNADTLTLQKTLTLVDARNLSDKRYTSHPTFLQQLQIADMVVANKEDLYTSTDRAVLDAFVADHCGSDVELLVTQNGRLPLQSLSGPPRSLPAGRLLQDRKMPEESPEPALPTGGVRSAVNQGEGFESIGWRFSPDQEFVRSSLYSFLTGLTVERMKAVFITDEGIFGYNLTRDALLEVEIDDCLESRVEIIAEHVDPAWEEELMGCLRKNRAEMGT